MAVCGYIKPDGARCKALPMKGEGYCYAHHPDLEDKRRAASSKGGKRGGRGRGNGGVKDVKAWLLKLASDVEGGKLEAKDGSVVSQILNVFLRGVEVERKIKESEELEERLEALESVLKNRDRRAG
jgi:hypothetical protein